MKPETAGNNMMLLTTTFRARKSFNLIPVTLDCPYVEAMYDPETKILACISKVHKQSYHMVPKLDDNGDPQRLKIGKREGGKTVREQRVLVDTLTLLNSLHVMKRNLTINNTSRKQFQMKEKK